MRVGLAGVSVWDHPPGGLAVGCSETEALPAPSLDGSRASCAHFPERATETERDSVVFEATQLRPCP